MRGPRPALPCPAKRRPTCVRITDRSLLSVSLLPFKEASSEEGIWEVLVRELNLRVVKGTKEMPGATGVGQETVHCHASSELVPEYKISIQWPFFISHRAWESRPPAVTAWVSREVEGNHLQTRRVRCPELSRPLCPPHQPRQLPRGLRRSGRPPSHPGLPAC